MNNINFKRNILIFDILLYTLLNKRILHNSTYTKYPKCYIYDISVNLYFYNNY